MGGLAQWGGAVNAWGGQSNWSLARAYAYKALVLLESHLNVTVDALNNTATIDVVYLSAILGTAVRRIGNHLMYFRHDVGIATEIPNESENYFIKVFIQLSRKRQLTRRTPWECSHY